MRILSKYRDYYDHISAHGQDHTRVWQRQCWVGKIPDNQAHQMLNARKDLHWDPLVGKKNWNDKNVPWSYRYRNPMDVIIVGFCDKLHLFRENRYWEMPPVYLGEISGTAYLRGLNKKLNAPIVITVAEESYSCNSPTGYKGIIVAHSDKPLEGYGNIEQLEDPEYADYSMKSLQFERVVPAFQAYQMIEQYVFDVLGGHKEDIPEMSNEVKIAQHGFNKESFRTGSPGSKKRKQRKKERKLQGSRKK